MVLSNQDIIAIADDLGDLVIVDDRIGQWGDAIEDPRRRALFMAAARLQQMVEGLAWSDGRVDLPQHPLRLPPRLHDLSFGFIPLGSALRREMERERLVRSQKFAFGVSIIGSKSINGPGSQERLGDITIGRHRFPVILSDSDYEPLGTPPHPGAPSTIGTATCWTEARHPKAAGWTKGILTARHLIRHLSLGTRVALTASATHSAPTTGHLRDMGHCAVDAAIIEIAATHWPAGLAPLRMPGPYLPTPAAGTTVVAAGDDVTLDGAASGSSTHKILSHHPLPGYWGSMMGQRLILDGHGVGGDSGGLVTHMSSGAGIGLFMGSITAPGGTNGICQDLYQASVYLDADLYL